MSIETWIRKDMFIYGQPLRNKQELKRSIKECEETIKQVREKIKSYVFMTEPQKFFPNEDDIMFYLDREFEELMEGLSNECKFNYDSSTIQLISEAISLSQEDSCEDNDSLPTLQELRQFPLLTPDLLHGADTLLQNSPCPTQSSTEQNVSKILIRS